MCGGCAKMTRYWGDIPDFGRGRDRRAVLEKLETRLRQPDRIPRRIQNSKAQSLLPAHRRTVERVCEISRRDAVDPHWRLFLRRWVSSGSGTTWAAVGGTHCQPANARHRVKVARGFWKGGRGETIGQPCMGLWWLSCRQEIEKLSCLAAPCALPERFRFWIGKR